MPTLQDHLARLADDAPRPPAGAGDLETRARRFHRRRRAGALVVAVVLLVCLTSIGVLDVLRGRPAPQPAGSVGAAALPTTLVRPSPWLPGTDDAGPPGVLAALVAADRGGWWGSERGVVGVSATTGEHRFLDLPTWTPDDVALAPDGRHVAFWLAGPGEDEVVGTAVYDTASGEVRRSLVPSSHGLEPHQLGWAGDEVLVLSFGLRVGPEQPGASTDARLVTWDIGDDELRPLRERGLSAFGPDWVGPDGLLAFGGGGGRSYRLVALDDPDRVRRVRVQRNPPGSDRGVAFARSPDRVAIMWGGPGPGARGPNRLLAGDLPPGRADADVRPPFVPRSGRTWSVQGWLDERHVVVTRLLPDAEQTSVGSLRFSLEAQDVETGEVRVLTTSEGDVTYASDLFARDSVARPAPQRPLDPRLVTGLVAASLLAAGLALRAWRRRVRP